MECFLVTQLNSTGVSIQTVLFQYLFHLEPEYLLVKEMSIKQIPQA